MWVKVGCGARQPTALETHAVEVDVDAATSVEARKVFSNNNLFWQASFRPKKGIEFADLVKATEAFRDTFGSEVVPPGRYWK